MVDHLVLNDIEKRACCLDTGVDSLVENLSGVLQYVSAVTVEADKIYKEGVYKTCVEEDSDIRGIYQVVT